MSDPVLTFVLIGSFLLAIAIAGYFKTLERGFAGSWGAPLIVGAVAGSVLAMAGLRDMRGAVIAGLISYGACTYLRHIGRESEPAEGALLGGVTGAAAAIPVALLADDTLKAFSSLVLAGVASGYGLTFASFHVTDRLRKLALDVMTLVCSVMAALAPLLANRVQGMNDRRVAVSVAVAIPLLTIISVFVAWRDVARELRDEAALGFIDDKDVRRASHPLLRFGKGEWADAGAHREFVRIANKIALRKRQQRNRPDDVARLYQLEIIKLRMQLSEMTRIGRVPYTLDERGAGDDLPSDRMHA